MSLTKYPDFGELVHFWKYTNMNIYNKCDIIDSLSDSYIFWLIIC